jgi:hypothetical protein
VNERALSSNVHLVGEVPRMIEQIVRNVAQDHAATRTNICQCSERDQSIARTDIEQRIACRNLAIGKHAVTYFPDTGKRPFEFRGIPSVTPIQNPVGPIVH